MAGRIVLTILGVLLAAFFLFTAVVRPAVERGGYGELALVILFLVGVLLAERWARSR